MISIDTVLLLVLILAVAGLAVVLVLRRRPRAEKPAQAPVDPFGSGDVDAVRGDPRTLGPGAIVEIRGESFAVRGSLRLAEDGWIWNEHLLENPAGRRHWLSVEEDPELELVLFTELPDTGGIPTSPGKTIELDGRTYRHVESGTATFTARGTTGLNPEGTVRYQDYATGGEDNSRLSLESYGESGKWEVSRGEVLSRYEVRIYPAAD